MRLLFLLFLAGFLTSCQDQFDPQKYGNTWFPDYEQDGYSAQPFIKFNKDSIHFIDIFDYHTVRKYEVKNGSIHIEHGDSTIIKSFEFSSKDSTLVIADKRYLYYPDYYPLEDDIRYQLIGLESPLKATAEELHRYETGFHLIRTNDTVNVKLNDRLKPFDDIPEFVMNTSPHFDLLGNVIYVGKGIQLQDVIHAYYQLASVNQLKVVLVTNFDLATGLYNIQFDRIDILNEQRDKYFVPQHLEVPHFEINNRTFYLEKYDPIIIKVNSKREFSKLDEINLSRNHLISINENLDLIDYLNLKQKIQGIRKRAKMKIRTEFNSAPPN